MKTFYLKIYNFLVWLDRTNQRPKLVGGRIICRKTPIWLSDLAQKFYKKSK